MTAIPRPDLSDRPLELICERDIAASPADVFAAWTGGFDRWFAQAGTLDLVPEPGRPYFFYNRDEWGRHPHYGRMLEVEENALVEMTWMTGNGNAEGTEGAETILRVELTASDHGTKVRLTHSGFASVSAHEAHEENWPLALEILDHALQG